MHYGHYLAQTSSSLPLVVRCLLVNLAIRQTPLERWRYRVLVMLEKSLGIVDMTKLRAILLLEVKFNSMNKILFNGCILPSLENS